MTMMNRPTTTTIQASKCENSGTLASVQPQATTRTMHNASLLQQKVIMLTTKHESSGIPEDKKFPNFIIVTLVRNFNHCSISAQNWFYTVYMTLTHGSGTRTLLTSFTNVFQTRSKSWFRNALFPILIVHNYTYADLKNLAKLPYEALYDSSVQYHDVLVLSDMNHLTIKILQ